MASKEYIVKRIAGAEAKLEKLNKKMDRIIKAKESGWTVNPYYYHESDIKWTQRDIDAATASLEKYRNDLRIAEEKEASRNVQVIIDFLENWKERCKKDYSSFVKKYESEYEEYRAKEQQYIEWFNYHRRNEPKEVIKSVSESFRAYKNEFHQKWSFLLPYIERAYKEDHSVTFTLDLEKLQKDLNEEANRKYDFIIERTNEIVGTITDASNLKIGAKGDLNGYIIGTNGVAKVQTIGAGGYNIQCFHFRTLINPMK